MENKELLFADEAKNALYAGILELATVVATTIGPNGNTVVIPDNTEYGKFKITKDGVSVAKSISYRDPYKNIAVKLMREVAEETVKVAGDGTTTSIVLALAFINLLSSVKLDSKTKARLDVVINDVIAHLDATKKKITVEDIRNVAMISSNGDSVITDNIVKAYSTINTKVSIEKTNKTEDTLETSRGLYIKEGSFDKSDWTRDNVQVIVTNKHVTDLTPYFKALDQASKTKQPVLIITPHISTGLLKTLALNKDKGLDVCVVKTPGFADHRENLITDISVYVGNYVYEDKVLASAHIGTVDKVTVTSKNTVIFKKDANVSNYIKRLQEDIEYCKEDHPIELLQQRIDRMIGHISTIYVGGHSEAEQSERYDRYEDAALAVACALEDGVVEGGGLALAKYAVSKAEVNKKGQLDFEGDLVLLSALLAPMNMIISNGAEINIQSDLISEGIVDPVKVTKTALLKAYNFAKIITTTNAIIIGKNYE